MENMLKDRKHTSTRYPWMAIILVVAMTLPAAGKQPVVEGGKLEFRLPDLAGELVDSADPRFTGKVVLVDLWATWCPPCLSEIPTFIDLQKQYGDQGLVIVAIAFEAEDQEQPRIRLQQFADQQGINYLILDGGPPENIGTALPALKNVKGFPIEILIDRTGHVRSARNGYGFKKKWAKRLRQEIEALLDEPAGQAREGPYVDTGSFSLALPLEVLATKLYVEVGIGGKPRRFVFDTGSPSMINAELAGELGLEVVDRRKGRDSHGAVIESDIVQADLVLGGVTFREVPMFASDLAASEAARCLIGDGVLGSEILPLCAWQIDLPDSVLRCDTEVAELSHVEKASRQRLYDFGYPHAPILDVRFAREARSKAMLDTGSPAYLAISPPDLGGAGKAGGIGRTVSGSGSLGASLGGQAPAGDQLQAELKTFSIGSLNLGRVYATRRAFPPSLIGAAILDHFVVTLDFRSGYAWFSEYRGGPFARPSFGFSLAFSPRTSVGLVWEDSPAARAGLRPGLPLTAINGEATSLSCDGIRSALRAMSGESIELEWEDGSASLSR